MKTVPRWKRTRFGSFVSSMTVAALRRELAVAGHPTHENTVYAWLHGIAVPRAGRMLELVRIGRGRINAEDVLRHRERIGDGVRQHRPRPMAGGTPEGDRRD